MIQNVNNAIFNVVKTSLVASTNNNYLVRSIKGLNLPCFTGQKRVVTEEEGKIYKMVYNIEGLNDNINSLLVSRKLEALAKSNAITADSFGLFVIMNMVNNDPFIITGEAIERITETVAFQTYKQNNANVPDLVDDTNNQLALRYVLQDPVLNRDKTMITAILSKYFVASDLSIENFGIKHGRLVLLDMGSILPLYPKFAPLCECGREKHLIVYSIDYRSPDEVNDGCMYTTRYGCSNENCSHYEKGSLHSNTIVSSDNVTFNTYMSKVQLGSKEYLAERFVYAYTFIPTNQLVNSFADFRNAVTTSLGSAIPNDTLMKVYRNVFPYIVSMLLDRHMMTIETLTDQYVSKLSFSQYIQVISNKTGVQVAKSPVLRLYLAIKYIVGKCNSTQVGLISIYDLVNTPWETFYGIIAKITDVKDAKEIKALHSCVTAI